MASGQKELNHLPRISRERHWSNIELRENKRLWDCMMNITNMNSQRNQIITLDDTARTNEPNDFFLRRPLRPLLMIMSLNSWKLVPIPYAFWKKCNYKYRGLDVLSASLLERKCAFCARLHCTHSSEEVHNQTVGPVALISVVMKCFEKLIVNMLKTEVAAN